MPLLPGAPPPGVTLPPGAGPADLGGPPPDAGGLGGLGGLLAGGGGGMGGGFPTTTPEGWGPLVEPLGQAAASDQAEFQAQQAQALMMALLAQLRNMGNPMGEAGMTLPASPLAMGAATEPDLSEPPPLPVGG